MIYPCRNAGAAPDLRAAHAAFAAPIKGTLPEKR